MLRLTALRRFNGFTEISLRVLRKFDKFNSEKFSVNAPAENFGLDSLDMVEYMIALEEELKVELTDEEALSVNTVEQAHNVFKKYKEV